jgi:hypothetical protein
MARRPAPASALADRTCKERSACLARLSSRFGLKKRTQSHSLNFGMESPVSMRVSRANRLESRARQAERHSGGFWMLLQLGQAAPERRSQCASRGARSANFGRAHVGACGTFRGTKLDLPGSGAAVARRFRSIGLASCSSRRPPCSSSHTGCAIEGPCPQCTPSTHTTRRSQRTQGARS